MGGISSNVAPVARIEDLVLTESGNELLIYDTRTSELHHLDQLSSVVWRNLDGKKTNADLVVLARAEVGSHVDEESIRLAIAALADINLLASDAPTGLFEGATSRRRFLKRSAGAGVAIPVIASVTAPSSAGAVSGLPTCSEVRSCNADFECGCNCEGDISEGICSEGVCANDC